MLDDDVVPKGPTGADRSYVQAVTAELYVLVLAGIATGVVVVGIGSRLAMLVLRLTSPGSVDGVTSDDGFTIGRFTLSGTYNLLLIGAAVGVLGAAAYQWVRPWLLGPRWFRLVTLALASGAVVGSMLVHADGIDFTVLAPMWLAVMLFVALPAAFAVCIALAVELVERRLDESRRGGWRRCILPALLVLAFPLTVPLLAVATAVLLVWISVRDAPPVRVFADRATVGAVARSLWLAVAVFGLIALLRDISELRSLA